MHTYLYRVNALFTVASTTLAVICAATALTDWSYTPNPSVDLKIKSYDGLQREYGQDRAWLTLALEADLQSVFHWNTKQAFVYVTAEFETATNQLNQAVVWSRIVESRAKAAIRDTVRMEYPYALTDPGLSMRNATFRLNVDWETVPIVGVLHRARHTFSGFRFPGEYFRTARVPRQTWQ